MIQDESCSTLDKGRNRDDISVQDALVKSLATQFTTFLATKQTAQFILQRRCIGVALLKSEVQREKCNLNQ